MSDAGASGELKKSFEDENKVNIEPTSVDLDCVKIEPNEEDSHATEYRVPFEYVNIIGEPSHQRKIEEDYDNLIGFRGNNVIMEKAMVKEEDDGSNNFHCSTHIQNTIETNTESQLRNHLSKRRSIKSFTCNICMQKFTLKGSLATHIKNKHTDDDAKDYKCSECSHLTNDKSNFQRHLNQHRGIKAFQCNICMMKFTEKCSLKRHIKNRHTDDGIAKDYKCSECSYQTNYKNHFQTHLNKHRGLKPFKCDICMSKFTLKGNLEGHIKDKHTDDVCVKAYKCLECFYQTNNKWHFQQHLNKHKGNKPFTCDICMMKFTEKRYLKMHMRNRHTDDGIAKDYKCPECVYQTNYKSHLQRHLSKHRGIKAFQCDICMVKFTEKRHLSKHITNKHTDDGSAKDYTCLECSYQTNYKSSFQMHMNKHRGIKPFKCDICMMTFTCQSSRNRHVKIIHTNVGSAND